jgi:N-acetylmuramoyl-L-alanine amidase
MRPAAIALLVLSACLPGRLGAELASIRSSGLDYVSLEDGAARLGLKLERSIPASTVMLKEGAQPLARLVDHSREADLRGLRVFFGDPVIEHGGRFYLSRTDYDTRLVPRLRPDLCGPPPRPPRVICLDPGHGGQDTGTENHNLHSMEKTYTLDVAFRLRKLLQAAGYAVVLTRETDVYVPLVIRPEIANRANADLFVSIHFNSLYPNTKTSGVEVLLFPPKTQRSTNSYSPGQKNDSQPGAEPINAFDCWNTVLAGGLHRRLLDTLHNGDRGEKFEHLGVLRQLKCPGVLLEPAFLSNDAEGMRLATPACRDAIAGAILAGIQDYAEVVRRLGKPEAAAAAPARAVPRRPSDHP